jgi:mannose-1-phosphate guanylyltransferase
MGKKKTGFKDMDKEYHLVLTIEDETTLLSSDLFINSGDRAAALFTEKIKELNPDVDQDTLESALDEGWYKWNNGVVLYTVPFSIFGKE